MGNLAIGQPGHHVLSRVESAWRTEHERAMLLNLSLAGNPAQSKHWVPLWKERSVTWRLVQVTDDKKCSMQRDKDVV